MLIKYGRFIAAPLVLAALFPFPLRSEQAGQNLEFRLMTIERRLDQMQSRLDVVEREQRMQTLQSANQPPAVLASVLELQRQHLSQAQQIIDLQQQLLALRKMIDPPTEGKKDAEKEKPKSSEPPRRRP